MSDILSVIAANKKAEIKSFYATTGLSSAIRDHALKCERKPFLLVERIRHNNVSGKPGIIAEFKRRSPSKGDIGPMADVAAVVHEYESGGASGISVLTDTRFFGGALTDLSLARQCCALPLLRKDFVVDELQLYEARVGGADVVLLIAAILEKEEIKDFAQLAKELNLEILYEIHDLHELDKMADCVDMVGVNNRALSTFKTDLGNSASLVSNLPSDKLKIAESGIKQPEDINRLMERGYNGFLIGESLMTASNPRETLKMFMDNGI